MSASKQKSHKGKGSVNKYKKKDPPAPHLDDDDFPALADETQLQTKPGKEKSKPTDESDSDESHHDAEEKTMNGTKDQSLDSGAPRPGKDEAKKQLSNGRCFSISGLWEKIPRFSTIQFRYHVPEQQNLFQKLEPYQHKISSYSTAFVIRTKILILAIFWLHVLSWLGLSLLLGLVNILTFFAGPWSLFPISGWCMILFCHFWITHRLLKGAGQNDLEWFDSKIWEYFDLAKDFSSQSVSVCKEKSHVAVTHVKAGFFRAYVSFKTNANHYFLFFRKKAAAN